MPRATSLNPELLEAALDGLEIKRKRIEEQIAEVQRSLGSNSKTLAVKSLLDGDATRAPRRELSAAARKRIAAAQKKRWADYRKKTGRGK